MPLVWDPAVYGTGIPELDAQHQELFHWVNRVLDAALDEKPAQELQILFSFLDEYVQKHFACEERLMEERRCASCDRNRAAHHVFLKEFNALKSRFGVEGMNPGFMTDMEVLIVGWMSQHIAKIDIGLRETP